MEHLCWKSNYTEWGTAWGTCNTNGDDQDWDDQESSESERNETEYECPHCQAEVDPFNWEDEDEEGESKPVVKPPIINEDTSAIAEDNDKHNIMTADCPTCKKRYEIDYDETELSCPYCGFEFLLPEK